MWAYFLCSVLGVHLLLRLLVPAYACITTDLWALVTVQMRPAPPPKARPVLRKPPPPIPIPAQWAAPPPAASDTAKHD